MKSQSWEVPFASWIWKVHGWKVQGWNVQGWKIHGWNIWGWKVHSWKVSGEKFLFALGLKSLGLKCPATVSTKLQENWWNNRFFVFWNGFCRASDAPQITKVLQKLNMTSLDQTFKFLTQKFLGRNNLNSFDWLTLQDSY